ncbi:hypothetical protein [Thalassotalea montiporae]
MLLVKLMVLIGMLIASQLVSIGKSHAAWKLFLALFPIVGAIAIALLNIKYSDFY